MLKAVALLYNPSLLHKLAVLAKILLAVEIN